jgi:hypothetical protein
VSEGFPLHLLRPYEQRDTKLRRVGYRVHGHRRALYHADDTLLPSLR